LFKSDPKPAQSSVIYSQNTESIDLGTQSGTHPFTQQVGRTGEQLDTLPPDYNQIMLNIIPSNIVSKEEEKPESSKL
jgi:hypothetical protein